MVRTYAAEERVTYAVTSHNNTRSVPSGVLYEFEPRSLLRNSAVNISATVNQHATIDGAVFFCGPFPRLYNDLTQRYINAGPGPPGWGVSNRRQ
jgi:hypothetical protein